MLADHVDARRSSSPTWARCGARDVAAPCELLGGVDGGDVGWVTHDRRRVGATRQPLAPAVDSIDDAGAP